MRGDVTVYSPKNVLCTMGIHIASGFTEDGFITITPQGDGVTDEAGADGEVVISIPDDPRYEIKLVLQYPRGQKRQFEAGNAGRDDM